MVTLARRSAASLLVLFAPIPALLGMTDDQTPVAVIAATLSVMLVSILIHIRRLEMQLLSRALLWSNLVWFTLVCVLSPPNPSEWTFLWWVTGIGAGLLMLGSDGLDVPGHNATFASVAMRGTLLAVLVLAMADTLALSFLTGAAAEQPTADMPLTFFVPAMTAMWLALYGLYRLRTWGFVLNVFANIAIAVTAWVLPDIPWQLAFCFSATAAGQLLAGLPLMWGIAKGGGQPTDSVGASPWIGATTVVLMLGTVFYRVFTA